MNPLTPGQNIAGLAKPHAFLQNRRQAGAGDGRLKGTGNGEASYVSSYASPSPEFQCTGYGNGDCGSSDGGGMGSGFGSANFHTSFYQLELP